MDNALLFVYGTLRRGFNSRLFGLIDTHADFAGYATCQGKLVLIDSYPGLVPSTNQDDKVVGEVYRLHTPDLVLSHLDQYEECGAGFPEPTEYVRELRSVQFESGAITMAWVYIYNWPTDNLQWLPSGDFLEVSATVV